jgi:hypothetical protein
MPDDVDEHADEAVHKLFPRSRFPFEAPVQDASVSFDERHVQGSLANSAEMAGEANLVQ